MALTQADLDALETALATGQKTVKYDGREVTFRDVGELKAAIAYVKGELDAAAGTTETQSLVGFSRD